MPPPPAQVDSKAATVLTEICAKCRPCCRGTTSEREWPSPVESPVRMLSVAAASPPSEAFTFSMAPALAARSAVEPESRSSGANAGDGANGPESALGENQSSDLGLSSGGLSHEVEAAVVPQSRNSPAVIFRVTHAGRRHKSSGCSPLASLPNYVYAGEWPKIPHRQSRRICSDNKSVRRDRILGLQRLLLPADAAPVQLDSLNDKLYQ